jgi:DNA-binding SARP family transcriptional activator/TolB-like protein
MLRLYTLGLVRLLGPDGRPLESVLAQPKRVALLSYLAIEALGRLQRRDTILGIFWPDLDEYHARAALRQALHGLRHSLGEQTFVSRGTEEVGVDADHLWCDVCEFDNAIERGELEEAVGWYDSHFMQGFFLHGAPEFDRWVEGQRRRLLRTHERALRELARRAEESGDFEQAVVWCERWVAQDPCDGQAVLHLMRDLDALGESAEAIRQAELHTTATRGELGAAPSPEVTELLEQLRAAPNRTGVTRLANHDEHPGDGAERTVEVVGVKTGASRWSKAVRAGAWSAIAIAGMSIGYVSSRLLVGERDGSTPRIAVLPIESPTPMDSAVRYDVLASETQIRLARLSGLSVIAYYTEGEYDPTGKTCQQIGDDLGATYLLDLTVFSGRAGEDPQSRRVDAQLIKASDCSITLAETYENRSGFLSLLEVPADITRRVAQVLDVALQPSELEQLSDTPTQSRRAWRSYLRAREFSSRSHRFEDQHRAVQQLEVAVVEDSMFADAHRALAEAYSALYRIAGDPEYLRRAEESLDRAVALGSGRALSPLFYYVQGQTDMALEVADLILADDRNNLDALYFRLHPGVAGRWRISLRLICT